MFALILAVGSHARNQGILDKAHDKGPH